LLARQLSDGGCLLIIPLAELGHCDAIASRGLNT